MKFSKKSSIALAIALTIVIANSQIAFAKNYEKNNFNSKKYSQKIIYQTKILSVKNLTKTVTQGDKFTLPTKVNATVKGNKTIEIPVTWNVKRVNTTKPGTYVFIGIVSGYAKPVTYKLIVNPLVKIAYIKDLEDEINEGDDFQLPEKVEAIMSNKTKKMVSVKWDKDVDEIEGPGEYVFNGTVQGYGKKVIFNLTVNETSAIENIDDINLNINQGDEFTPPETVEATMNDGSTQDVAVEWDGDLDVNTPGEYTLLGTVEGYDGQVILTVNVQEDSQEEATIETISNINPIEIKKGEKLNLPETVTANMDDHTTKEVNVKWENNIDTSIPGEYTLQGTVEGYENPISVKVIITEPVVQP